MIGLMVASNSQTSERAPIREGYDSEVSLSIPHRHDSIDSWQDHFLMTRFIAVSNAVSKVLKSYDAHILAYDHSLAQRLSHTRHEVEMLAQTAGHANWDDEGADEVTAETISLALALVAAFPYSEHPDILGDDLDIEATPFGSIDFGWALERDVRMNVIALVSGEIGFAYSVHGERDNGKEPWTGKLPYRVWEAFDKVFNRTGLGG